MEEPDVLRRGLDALCRKADGTAAAAKTVKRKKAAVNEVFGVAVERGYFSQNPLSGLRWSAPEVADEVDPDCVPNPAQAGRLLAAVKALPGRGPWLQQLRARLTLDAIAEPHPGKDNNTSLDMGTDLDPTRGVILVGLRPWHASGLRAQPAAHPGELLAVICADARVGDMTSARTARWARPVSASEAWRLEIEG
ncbi:hypothetical protein ABT124_38050 [Streptomyces sp. NPDC001982]|uniref:hypothetical protein n=1 Tax=Streptomyces sp. NPDC001982 TaxID=3154405 RepID=UPI00331922BC